jgi:hypothetical protein
MSKIILNYFGVSLRRFADKFAFNLIYRLQLGLDWFVIRWHVSVVIWLILSNFVGVISVRFKILFRIKCLLVLFQYLRCSIICPCTTSANIRLRHLYQIGLNVERFLWIKLALSILKNGQWLGSDIVLFLLTSKSACFVVVCWQYVICSI